MSEAPEPKLEAALVVGGVCMAVGFVVFGILWSIDALLEALRQSW